MPVVNTHVCAQEHVCLDRPLPVFQLFRSLKEWFQKNTKSVGLEFLLSEINESCGRDSDKLIMLCLLCFYRLKKNITIIELINSVGFSSCSICIWQQFTDASVLSGFFMETFSSQPVNK